MAERVQTVEAPEIEPDYAVFCITNANVTLDVVHRKGGVVPFKFLTREGGAQIRKGKRIRVFKSVADELVQVKHQSMEPGREGQFVPSFTIEGPSLDENGDLITK